jgi:predicted P-loop ATPase
MSKLDDIAREQERVAEKAKELEKKAERKAEQKKKKQHAEGWQKKLRSTTNGKELRGDFANVFLAFEHCPKLIGLIRYNQLSRCVELQRAPPWRTLTDGIEWSDDDDIDLANFLQLEDIPVTNERMVARVAHSVATKNSFHPVADWLRSLKWDGEPRIKEVLIETLGAQGDAEYLNGVLRRFLISAVARAFKPGTKCDHMLVLIGPQGTSKSTFAQVLGGKWAVESNSTFGTKDSIQELEGAWIIEVGELSSLSRSRLDTMNHYVSRLVDHFRPSYGRAVVNQKRSCVFIGTTNEIKFLRDYTGGRRFWPIMCGEINLQLLRDNLEQLWAEAVAAFNAGEQWYLTKAEEKLAANIQEGHRVISEIEEDVRGWLENCLLETPKPRTTTTVNDVFNAIAGDHERRNLSARRQVEQAIAQAMRRAGWVCKGRHGQMRRTYYEYTPPEGGDEGDEVKPTFQHLPDNDDLDSVFP